MGRAKKSASAIFNILKTKPKVTIPELVKLTDLTKQTVWKTIKALEKNGASVVILEKDLNEDVLYNEINDIVNNRQKLDCMAQNSAKMGIIDANEKIYQEICHVGPPYGRQ